MVSQKWGRVTRHFRRSSTSSADRPNGFVCKQNTGKLLIGQRTNPARALSRKHRLSVIGVTLFQSFTDANDRNQSRIQRGNSFLRDHLIRFAENVPTLAVPQNYITASCFDEHWRGDFSGKRALFFPVHVLRGNRNVRSARSFRRRGQ